ncbi:Eco57I restriction-modification methylase domain-containing protein [Halorussus halophilus]|uniref:Eco57I restriction-modification methylase domain-containing protein n=1 Tax=Halorussus halophilus TaxID=2650975 RepID=UPI0013019171|nr:TaqI-like C-terminal specificity domain-containing protein [Halorussus halophilus]
MTPATGYRTSRGCFTEAYLDEYLPDTSLWNAAAEREVRNAYEEFRRLYDEQSSSIAEYDADELRANVVRPALEILDVRAVGDERLSEVDDEQVTPDYLLYEREHERQSGRHEAGRDRSPDTNPLAVAEFVLPGQPLDAPAGRDSTPNYRLHDAIGARDVEHGVSTDGRLWRRYYAPASRRLDSYYEIDLPALLETRDTEAFKYFYLFFRRESFGASTDGERFDPATTADASPTDSFVAKVHERYVTFVESLTDDLGENAREALVSVASELFVEGDAGEVSRVYDAALTVVVRLVLALYAESEDCSLLGRPVLGDASARRQCAGADKSKRRAGASERWNRLNRSFEELAGESGSSDVTELLSTRTICDERLSEIAESLATRELASGESARIDFSALSVRHLGRLHERLLEYDLAVADEPMVAVLDGGEEQWRSADEYESGSKPTDSVESGDLYLTTDAGERKSSGSYYTPEAVVEYTVERALEPLVADVRDELDPSDPEYAATFAERVLESNVLDPAMGSGHFLVAAAEYLGRAVVRAQRRQVERTGANSLTERRDVRTARREVAQRCLYGVDSDELAVELATASLWLETHDADQSWPDVRNNLHPHLAHGNSLVGLGPEEFFDELEQTELSRGQLDEIANVRVARRFGSGELPDDAHERLLDAAGDESAWRAVTRESWFRAAQSLADEAAFLHWRSSFPEVFDADETDSVGGFDAVVGNPPYVRNRALDAQLKAYCRETFDSAAGAYDLYVPFVELACDLGRHVSLVVPNKWTTTEYGRALRDQLLDRHALREILNASAPSVFADATVYPVVVTVDCENEEDCEKPVRVRRPENCRALTDAPVTTVPRALIDRFGGRVIPLDFDGAFADLAAGVLDQCFRFGDHVRTTEAIHTGNARETLVVDECSDADSDGEDDCHRLVDGTCVDRYRLDWDGRWIRYDDGLLDDEAGEYADLRDPTQFAGKKLFVRDISKRPVAVYDDEDFYALNTLYTVRERDDSDLPLRYLLGVFNSAFVARYFRQVYGGTHVSGDYLRYKPSFTDEIPVPDPDPARVSPREVATDSGVETAVPADPADAIAELTERLRPLCDERATLDTDVLDYLSELTDGPKLSEWGVPVAGVAETILTETACEREGLRVGMVEFERDGVTPVLSATARYKPTESDDATDRWGFAETEPIPALWFPDHKESAALLEAFVPAAVERANGFAEFRENATKTYSLLDRLRGLRLPDAETVAEEFARFEEARERAETLDDEIASVEDAIDGIVYRLYGFEESEIETVEQLASE